MTHRLDELFSKAWSLRRDQRLEECRATLAQLKQLSTQVPHGSTLRSKAEVKLLSASIARACGRMNEAKAGLSEAESLWSASPTDSDPGPNDLDFRLSMEKGLNAFLEGDFEVALDHFLLAETQAAATVDRASAAMNAVLSQENLGLPYENTRARVERLVKVAKSHGLEAQLRALRMREFFRAGQLRRALALDSGSKKDFDQSRYYALFLRALPYHTGFSALPIEVVAELAEAGSFHLRGFRFRTLQAMLHPDDLSPLKASEIADRIYLWTWAWLCDPQRFPAQRIAVQLEKSRLLERVHTLTLEDRLLLKNALKWLALFDPSHRLELERVSRSLLGREAAQGMALVDFESLVVSYLEARLGGNQTLARDFERALKAHPLWDNRELRFRDLLEALDEPRRLQSSHPLSGLALQLRAMISHQREQSRASIVVDLERGELRFSHRDGIRSGAMTQAFALLIEGRGNVACEDFVRRCWGYSRYDSLVHGPKIFNLLSRMRAVSPKNLRLGVKSGRVFAQGDFSGFQVLRAGAHTQSLSLEPSWREFLRQSSPAVDSTTQKPSSDSHSSQAWPEWLRRRDLEARLKTSRATAGRLLARWESEGHARKEGSTRDARYRLSRALRSRLQTEGVEG